MKATHHTLIKAEVLLEWCKGVKEILDCISTVQVCFLVDFYTLSCSNGRSVDESIPHKMETGETAYE